MPDELSTSVQRLLPRLARNDDEIKILLKGLHDVNDVANLLEIPLSQFTHLIWRSQVSSRYHVFRVKKRRNGYRDIASPNNSIKILQTKLLHALQLIYTPRTPCHAFAKSRSIISNATLHVNQRWVLNIDLKDFFPSIHFGRIRGLFRGKPYNMGDRAATALAQLCCHQKCLPQGAPTSPILSNMICAKMDSELRRLAEANRCRYTRYADDITFSTSLRKFPEELAIYLDHGVNCIIGSSLKNIITLNGFIINSEKTRLQSRKIRQVVTGLTVNRRPNVPTKLVSQIRAMLNAWEKYGYEKAEAEFLARYDRKHRPRTPRLGKVFKRVVRGKLDFLKQVRGHKDARYCHLRRRFGRLIGEVVIDEHSLGDPMEFDVFLCHASEDKAEVVFPLRDAFLNDGIKPWIDAGEMKWGNSLIALGSV